MSTYFELPDTTLEPLFAFIGGVNVVDIFLAVNRQWFNAGACHPSAFREPTEQWRSATCRQLEEQLVKHMHDPPPSDQAASLHVAVDHAEDELRLTQVSAAFLRNVTAEFLEHARRLSAMLKWIHIVLPHEPKRGMSTPARQQYVWQEADEFHSRAVQLCGAVEDLLVRLPDPALPVLWAEWFDEMGQVYGLPEEHRARYRSQREQVAVLWANNRQTFASAYGQLQTLVSAFRTLHDESDDRRVCAQTENWERRVVKG